MIQLVRNQNVTKKQHYKTAEELLPYLQEYPEHLEHPTVKKVLGIIGACMESQQLAELMQKIVEEIEIEEGKEDPDQYLIHRLSNTYLTHNKAAI